MLKGYVEKYWGDLSARFADEGVGAALSGEATPGGDAGGGGAAPDLKIVEGGKPSETAKADPFIETMRALGPEYEAAFKEGGKEALKAALLDGVRARQELEVLRRPKPAKEDKPDPDAIYDQIEDSVDQEVNKALAQLPRSTSEQEAWKVAQRVAARTRNKLLHKLALDDMVGITAAQRQNEKIREAKRSAFFKMPGNKDLEDYFDLIEEMVEEDGYDAPIAAAKVRKFLVRAKETLQPKEKEDVYEEEDEGVAYLDGLTARQSRSLRQQFRATAGRRSSGGGRGNKPGDWGVTEAESKSYWRSQARDQ